MTPQEKINQQAQQRGLVKASVQRELLSPKVVNNVGAILRDKDMADQFIRIALGEITKNNKLAQCSPQSLIRAVYEAASLKLAINGILGHAYLVPFGGRSNQAQLIIGYRGFIDLAHRSGKIASITSDIICENELHSKSHFDYQKGTDEYIHHKPIIGDRGKPVAAYAVAKLITGGNQIEILSEQEINLYRDKSSGWKAYQSKLIKDCPWADPLSLQWMWRKTAIRQLCKLIPQSPELVQAAVADELREFGVKNLAPITPAVEIIDEIDGLREPGNEG